MQKSDKILVQKWKVGQESKTILENIFSKISPMLILRPKCERNLDFFYIVIKFGLQLWHFQDHNWKSYYIVKYIFQKMPKKRSRFGLNISIDDNLGTFFSKIFLHSCQNFHFCNNIFDDEICLI